VSPHTASDETSLWRTSEADRIIFGVNAEPNKNS
jgi:hypothetical protein